MSYSADDNGRLGRRRSFSPYMLHIHASAVSTHTHKTHTSKTAANEHAESWTTKSAIHYENLKCDTKRKCRYKTNKRKKAKTEQQRNKYQVHLILVHIPFIFCFELSKVNVWLYRKRAWNENLNSRIYIMHAATARSFVLIFFLQHNNLNSVTHHYQHLPSQAVLQVFVFGSTETQRRRPVDGGEKAIAKTHHDRVIFAVIYHYLFMHRSFVPCNLFVVRQWMQIKLPEWTEWWRWAFNILYHWWPRHHAMKRQNAKFDFDCGGSCIHI